MINSNWLFAHDTRFARRKRQVYTADAFPPDMWERYLAHAEHLTVLAREFDSESKASEADLVSSTVNVDFHLGPNISSPTKHITNAARAKAVTRKAVAAADGVIARLPSEYGLLAAAEAEHRGKPWLLEMAGCPWDGLWNYGNWQGKVYAPVMATRVRRAAARAPFAIYVTREFLQRRYPNRMGQHIHCSNVVIENPKESVLAERMRRIGKQKRPVKIGLIGTLRARYKGIQTVFAALARARGCLPPLSFHVLGTGDAEPWRKEAKAYGVGDLVHFDAPRTPGAEVMEWLDDIDIYLQPSFKEGLPRATIEAMSRGCPIIGSFCAGIPELLSNDCLIKPGDDEHLAQLIQKAVNDAGWQKEHAKANWQQAHEYSSEILNARRNELLTVFAQAVHKAKVKAAAV